MAAGIGRSRRRSPGGIARRRRAADRAAAAGPAALAASGFTAGRLSGVALLPAELAADQPATAARPAALAPFGLARVEVDGAVPLEGGRDLRQHRLRHLGRDQDAAAAEPLAEEMRSCSGRASPCSGARKPWCVLAARRLRPGGGVVRAGGVDLHAVAVDPVFLDQGLDRALRFGAAVEQAGDGAHDVDSPAVVARRGGCASYPEVVPCGAGRAARPSRDPLRNPLGASGLNGGGHAPVPPGSALSPFGSLWASSRWLR